VGESTPKKTTAIVAYLTLVGCLIAITMNIEPKNTFARLHIRQAFGIHLLYHSLAFFFNYSGVDSGWMILYVAYLFCLLYGLIGTVQEKPQTLPLVGPYFQKWFTFIP